MKTKMKKNSAFTLVELLVVLVVLGLLVAVAAPTFVGTGKGTRITAAGDLLLNKLSEAQQQALASNAEVEVRFFENKSDPMSAAPRLRAFQLMTVGEGSGGAEVVPASAILR